MARRHFLATTVAVVVLAAIAAALAVNSAKKVTVGQTRRAPGSQPLDAIDHAAWDQLLKKYVNDQGQVAYAAWKASAADLSALEDYLAELSRGEPSELSRRDGRLAFWVNAYNAVCLWGILRAYPIDSVTRPGARFWQFDLQRDLLLEVGGRRYSLDNLRQEVVKLDAPSALLAIGCTYANGPLLRNSAYSPDRIEAQLTDNARHLFARPGSLRIEAQSDELLITPALESYQTTLGLTPSSAAAAVSVYFPDAASRAMATSGRSTIRYLPVEQRLNEQTPRKDANP